jgi:ADP-dependent NAD(P)H-hydrate dehydratase / NAD(P)H-hydrate epimerase
MKIVTIQEMKDIEAAADAGGLSYAELMRHAGTGVGKWIIAHMHPEGARTALGLIGSGNNGGDTLVALTLLAASGWGAVAYLVRPRPADDPLITEFTKAGGTLLNGAEDTKQSKLAGALDAAAVWLDGILGTGIRLPLEPAIADTLRFTGKKLAGKIKKPVVVAVDCPSGVDCDSGEAADETLPANFTLTMAAAKLGLFIFPAFKYAGQVLPISIGIPETGGLLGAVKRQVIDDEFLRGMLPERRLDAHKGDFGMALLLVGSQQYTGAALLSGRAAYRVGAGIVTLGVVEPVYYAIAGHLPEAIWMVLPDLDGFMAAGAADIVLQGLDKVDALLIGCGWGLREETHQFMRMLLSEDRRPLPPMVVDADALRLLSRVAGWQSQLPRGSVLTPHPGEMAALTGLTVDEVQEDRLGLAERMAQAWNQVVVLKGALTVVANPDGRTAIIPMATPALARAGTGDILAGMITGFIAQGVDGFSAACAAAYLHGLAGVAAADAMGNTASILAGDILNCLSDQISRINKTGGS